QCGALEAREPLRLQAREVERADEQLAAGAEVLEAKSGLVHERLNLAGGAHARLTHDLHGRLREDAEVAGEQAPVRVDERFDADGGVPDRDAERRERADEHLHSADAQLRQAVEELADALDARADSGELRAELVTLTAGVEERVRRLVQP